MKYRELRRKLRERGVEEDVARGKGSHRTFRRGEVTYTVPYHGNNRDVPRGYIRDLERIFGIDLQA